MPIEYSVSHLWKLNAFRRELEPSKQWQVHQLSLNDSYRGREMQCPVIYHVWLTPIFLLKHPLIDSESTTNTRCRSWWCSKSAEPVEGEKEWNAWGKAPLLTYDAKALALSWRDKTSRSCDLIIEIFRSCYCRTMLCGCPSSIFKSSTWQKD